jgi:hypothetical protein
LKHGQWSRDPGVQFNAKTCEFYREQIEFLLPVSSQGEEMKHPEAGLRDRTINGSETKWPPPAKNHKLFLQPSAARVDEPDTADGFDDTRRPAKPVPFID